MSQCNDVTNDHKILRKTKILIKEPTRDDVATTPSNGRHSHM